MAKVYVYKSLFWSAKGPHSGPFFLKSRVMVALHNSTLILFVVDTFIYTLIVGFFCFSKGILEEFYMYFYEYLSSFSYIHKPKYIYKLFD